MHGNTKVKSIFSSYHGGFVEREMFGITAGTYRYEAGGQPCSSSVCEVTGYRPRSHSSSLQTDSHWNLCSKMRYHMRDLRFSQWCHLRSKSWGGATVLLMQFPMFQGIIIPSKCRELLTHDTGSHRRRLESSGHWILPRVTTSIRKRAFCPSPLGSKLWTFISIPNLHSMVMKYKGIFTVL